jgi:hypothetical protein
MTAHDGAVRQSCVSRAQGDAHEAGVAPTFSREPGIKGAELVQREGQARLLLLQHRLDVLHVVTLWAGTEWPGQNRGRARAHKPESTRESSGGAVRRTHLVEKVQECALLLAAVRHGAPAVKCGDQQRLLTAKKLFSHSNSWYNCREVKRMKDV